MECATTNAQAALACCAAKEDHIRSMISIVDVFNFYAVNDQSASAIKINKTTISWPILRDHGIADYYAGMAGCGCYIKESFTVFKPSAVNAELVAGGDMEISSVVGAAIPVEELASAGSGNYALITKC
jgi:hypothetical protein